jgi:dTDP-4-dehydrorhamnose reductase
MRRAWESGATLTLFTDEFRNPIPATATARALWEIVSANQQGIYHLGGAERLSRWEIGQLLAAHSPEWTVRLRPGSLRNYQGLRRSPDTTLNCAKAQGLLSFPLPAFSAWLAENAESLKR